MNDYALLALLLKREYSLKDALEFLVKEEKMLGFNKLKNCLNEGKDIDLCLTSKFEKEIGFYVKYLPLADAIEITIDNYSKRRKRFERIVNKGGYSFLLIILAFILITIFVKYVLTSFIDSYQIDTQIFLIRFVYLLYYSKNLIVIIFSIFFIFISFFIVGKKENYLWGLLHRFNLDLYLKEVVSIMFIEQMNCLLEKGVSIKTGLEIIRTNSNNQLVRFVAYRVDEKLNKGTTFQTALKDEYLDKSIYALSIYGIKDLNLCAGFNNYLVIKEERIMKLIDKGALILKGISYVLVGIVVITMYQVLLLPLQSLEDLL